MILFISCEKDADIKLPEQDTKLSVYGFLSPEDSITNIVVKNTRPYYGKKGNNKIDYITNAQVKIKHNENEYILPFYRKTNSYYVDSNDLKIIPGEEYYLEVKAQDYPEAVASTIIPKYKNESFEFIEKRKLSSTAEVFFNVKWIDNSEEKNYYRLAGYTDVGMLQQEYYPEGEVLDKENVFLFDDADWNGQVKSSGLLSCYEYYNDENTIIYVHLILLNINYDYYSYHRSVRDFNNNDENPFSEPVIVYSNVKKGTGIFAAYRKSEIITNL